MGHHLQASWIRLDFRWKEKQLLQSRPAVDGSSATNVESTDSTLVATRGALHHTLKSNALPGATFLPPALRGVLGVLATDQGCPHLTAMPRASSAS